jgi:hypothetical protein
MKTFNSKLAMDIFSEFVLSNEEMISIRGGDDDSKGKPTTPPVNI